MRKRKNKNEPLPSAHPQSRAEFFLPLQCMEQKERRKGNNWRFKKGKKDGRNLKLPWSSPLLRGTQCSQEVLTHFCAFSTLRALCTLFGLKGKEQIYISQYPMEGTKRSCFKTHHKWGQSSTERNNNICKIRQFIKLKSVTFSTRSEDVLKFSKQN